MTYTSQHIIPEDLAQNFNKYAFPVFKTVERLCQTSNNDLKLIEKRLLETFEITLRYITHIGIGDFVASKEHNKNIENQLKGLARPSLGMYSSLIRELAKHAQRSKCLTLGVLDEIYQSPLAPPVFSSLCDIARLFDYKTPKKCNNYKQLIDVLVIYRNKGDAHAVSRSRKSYLEIVPKLTELVQSLLEICRPLTEGTLVRVVGRQCVDDGEKYTVENWNAGKPTLGTMPARAELATEHIYAIFAPEGQEPVHIDLYPFFYVDGYEQQEPGSAVIYSLNEIKKSRLEFVNFQTGSQLIIKSDSPKFSGIMEGATSTLATKALSDGYNPLLEMGVSPEAELKYNHAMVSIRDEFFDTAIMLLGQAVEDSPLYREALLPLSQLQIEEGDPLGARETLKEYLELFPSDLDFLLADTKALLAAHDTDTAQARLDQIRVLNPDHPELEKLEKQRQDIDFGLEEKGSEELREVLLPHHVISQHFFGDKKYANVLTLCAITLFTIIISVIFEFQNDRLMAITMVCFGLLWASVQWTTNRIWSVLKKSEPNFAAFLRSRKGKTPATVIRDLVCPILGCYRLNRQSGSDNLLTDMFKRNSLRFTYIMILSIISSIWFFFVSAYSSPSIIIDIIYGTYTFLFSLSFIYLISCLIEFQTALKKLRNINIHFNIVQHPKLSVRYLSYLSRKILFPMILIYMLFTFMFYLGPFLANIQLVIALTLLVIFLCYSYYSTIFLVKSIITQNKWRLISQFSTHFHTPFTNLVTEGHPKDLSRIKELMEARDYIDSIDVWAERKVVLIGMSIFFVSALIFSTIGLSNVMTRHIMPLIARSAAASTKEVSDMVLPMKNGQPTIEIDVENVDDSFIVLWAPSFEELDELVTSGIKTNNVNDIYGLKRCNWETASHGELEALIQIKNEMHILLVGYNKIYKGFLGMGGGKYSHMLTVLADGKEIIESRQFIKINTKEMPYAAYLRIKKNGNSISIHREVGAPLPTQHARVLTQTLENILRTEDTVEAFSSIATKPSS